MSDLIEKLRIRRAVHRLPNRLPKARVQQVSLSEYGSVSMIFDTESASFFAEGQRLRKSSGSYYGLPFFFLKFYGRANLLK